jgi:hypothetical protein
MARNLTGLEDVSRVFAAAPRKAAASLTAALNKGADEIAASARAIAPAGDDDDRRMRDHIVVKGARPSARRRGGVVATVEAGRDPADRDAAFRSEFGRAPSSDGHPGHAAQPFLFPAFWSLRKRARSRVARALRAAVKSARNG